MVRLTADGKYRGPFGRDPKKSRAAREQELLRLANSQEGTEIILALWMEAKRIPFGTCPPVGTMVKQEMVPDILAFEYPNG